MASYMVENLISVLENGGKYKRVKLFDTDLIEGETA